MRKIGVIGNTVMNFMKTRNAGFTSVFKIGVLAGNAFEGF